MEEPTSFGRSSLELDGKHIEKDISTPADFTDPEELYQRLINSVRMYHPNTDISMIEKAYHIAKKAHEGQRRKSENHISFIRFA